MNAVKQHSTPLPTIGRAELAWREGLRNMERETNILNDLQGKLSRAEADLKPKAEVEKELAGLEAQQQQFLAEAYLSGAETNSTTPQDREIAACRAKLADNNRKAAYVNSAKVLIEAQMADQRQVVAMLRQQAPRLLRNALDELLAASAGPYKEAIAAFQTALVEVSAIALARDRVGATIQGNSGVGSAGLAQADFAAPAHPAFNDIRAHVDLQKQADARMAEILDGLDAQLR